MPSNLEIHRAQFAASLSAVAESMRNCAQLAETFAKVVNDPAYSQEAADMLHVASEESAKGKSKAAHLLEDGEGTKKRKRNTKPKDPNAPKRPASSYILFQNEVRKELKEQHPNLSNADLLGMISEQWKHMSDEQKETYNQAMKMAKAQYSEEKKAYDNRTPEEIQAANAAAAAALLLKKANAKPRGPKPAGAAAAANNQVKARPPPTADQVLAESGTSEDDDSEEEVSLPVKPVQDDSDSDSETEEPEPAPKKRRGTSAQPKDHKSKKSSKA